MSLRIDQCHYLSCGRPRIGKLFCEEHRREVQMQAAACSDPPHGRDRLWHGVYVTLQNYDLEAVTRSELHCMLADLLLRAHIDGRRGCWDRCFSEIPVSVLLGLGAFLADPKRPHLFSPLPESAPARQDLIEALRQWLSTSPKVDPPPNE